ncbi:MAG: hypothetical protein NTV32_03550 [Gammaproteobacteria bacterium]|nr:hypothetical protein [Gammaproteobacteria bacterium]
MKNAVYPICFGTCTVIFLAILGLLVVSPHDWTHYQVKYSFDLIELIIQAITIVYTIKVFRKIDTADRGLFIWLLLSTLALFVNQTSYHIMMLASKHGHPLGLWARFLLFYLPYLTWLLTLMVFVGKSLFSYVLKHSTFFILFTLLATANLVLILLFFYSHNAELVLLELTLLCMMCAKDLGMQFFLTGVACILSSAFLFNYSYVGNADPMVSNYAVMLWFLALIFMLFGILLLDKHQSFSIKNHFNRINAIRSRLVLWTFGVAVGSFLGFFVILHTFSMIDNDLFGGLSFFVSAYAVVVVLLSIWMGKRLETPFKTLTHNIEVLMHKNDKTQLNQHASTIDEFIFLQNFIVNAFEFRDEKDRVKKKFGEMCAAVAHDVDAPTEALLGLADESKTISETDRLALRRASQEIKDIANGILDQYKQ